MHTRDEVDSWPAARLRRLFKKKNQTFIDWKIYDFIKYEKNAAHSNEEGKEEEEEEEEGETEKKEKGKEPGQDLKEGDEGGEGQMATESIGSSHKRMSAHSRHGEFLANRRKKKKKTGHPRTSLDYDSVMSIPHSIYFQKLEEFIEDPNDFGGHAPKEEKDLINYLDLNAVLPASAKGANLAALLNSNALADTFIKLLMLYCDFEPKQSIDLCHQQEMVLIQSLLVFFVRCTERGMKLTKLLIFIYFFSLGRLDVPINAKPYPIGLDLHLREIQTQRVLPRMLQRCSGPPRHADQQRYTRSPVRLFNWGIPINHNS